MVAAFVTMFASMATAVCVAKLMTMTIAVVLLFRILLMLWGRVRVNFEGECIGVDVDACG